MNPLENTFYKFLSEEAKECSGPAFSSDTFLVFSPAAAESDSYTADSILSVPSVEYLTEHRFSRPERLSVKHKLMDKEAEKDLLVERLFWELVSALQFFEYENENFTSAEKKIIEIEHRYNMRILGEIIQNVYVRHFDNPRYLTGICKALLRYDLDEVSPWGVIMLTGFLNHPDEQVKEYAIQLIDNWNDTELLPILKTLHVSSEWLNNYINDVIENLEKKDVLYQKIV